MLKKFLFTTLALTYLSSANAINLECSTSNPSYQIKISDQSANVSYRGNQLGGGDLACAPGQAKSTLSCRSIHEFMRKDSTFVGFTLDLYEHANNNGSAVVLRELHLNSGKTYNKVLGQIACQ